MIARGDGTPDFHPFRSQRRGSEAVLFAFDLIEHDGDDLRDLPLIERKRRLARLARPGREPSGTASTWQVTVRPCSSMSAAWGWRDAPYRSGPSKVWLEAKNPAARRCGGGNVRRSGTPE